MRPCERHERQEACNAAGEHVCGTKYVFALTRGDPITECPGCVPVPVRGEQYCTRHCSHVTLEEVRAAWKDEA